MKTMQELYDEVIASKELQAKFIEAEKAGKAEVSEFLKENGCNATLEDVTAFLRAKGEEDTSLSLDELQQAAGGIRLMRRRQVNLTEVGIVK